MGVLLLASGGWELRGFRDGWDWYAQSLLGKVLAGVRQHIPGNGCASFQREVAAQLRCFNSIAGS